MMTVVQLRGRKDLFTCLVIFLFISVAVIVYVTSSVLDTQKTLGVDFVGVSHQPGLAAASFTEHVEDHQNRTQRIGNLDLCNATFKSWIKGTVTQVKPLIQANCTLLFKKGNKLEVERVRQASSTWPAKEHALNFTKWVEEHGCTHLKEEMEDNFYVSEEEVEFPLAFTMVVHNNAFQVYRLLKVLYRPHNIYCVHYDNKSSVDMKQLFIKLAKCFDNIIISSSIISVHWGRHSLMDAQMNCFGDLLRHHDRYPWNYVITLCGKELPLRTNREIVKLLKPLKGNSAILALSTPRHERERYKIRWTVNSDGFVVPTKENTGPVPYSLTIYKSMIYFALTPEFVNYTINDVVAISLSKFLEDALAPEEHFYSTLFMIPGVPGGYNASLRPLVPVVSTYTWATNTMKKPLSQYCTSEYIIHGICIMTSADLFRVSSELKMDIANPTGPIFHNKYFMERDHTVMDCVEEELVTRNLLEYNRDCLAQLNQY